MQGRERLARAISDGTATLPVTQHAAEVVALEIDDHHVLGALLRVREQRCAQRRVAHRVGVARPRALDRLGVDAAAPRPRRKRSGEPHRIVNVAAVEVGAERHALRRAQARVDARRVGIVAADAEALRQVHLVDVAGGDVVERALDRLAMHIGARRFDEARCVVRARGRAPGRRRRAAPQRRCTALRGRGVAGMDARRDARRAAVVARRVRHDLDHRVVARELRQRQHAARVAPRPDARLEQPDQVVGEEADGVRGRTARQRRRAGDELLDRRERVAVQRAAHARAQQLERAVGAQNELRPGSEAHKAGPADGLSVDPEGAARTADPAEEGFGRRRDVELHHGHAVLNRTARRCRC